MKTMYVGQNFQLRRKKLSLTQKYIADRTRVFQSYVSKIENGIVVDESYFDLYEEILGEHELEREEEVWKVIAERVNSLFAARWRSLGDTLG